MDKKSYQIYKGKINSHNTGAYMQVLEKVAETHLESLKRHEKIVQGEINNVVERAGRLNTQLSKLQAEVRQVEGALESVRASKNLETGSTVSAERKVADMGNAEGVRRLPQ